MERGVHRDYDKSRYSDIVFVESTKFRGIPISILSKFRGISKVTIELSRNSESSEFQRNSETSEFRGHPSYWYIPPGILFYFLLSSISQIEV
jgi:hypothetical protein